MTYCIEVWGCASQTQLNCLFLLQKKILRIMNFSHYLAYTNPLFLSMEVLPLRKYFFYKVELIMYKYSLNLLPECIAHLYLRNDSIHEHNTRGCHELRVLPGAKSFSNISARIWNVLSNKINLDVSMSIFKCNLKLFLWHNELVLTLERRTRHMCRILGQNPPGQNPPDKTPRIIPRWTKPPDGQNPPVDKPPLDKPPRTKPPGQNPPPRTKPPGQNPPGQNPPGQNPPGQNPPGQNPPDKTPRTKSPRTKPPRTIPPRTKPPRTKPPRTKPPHPIQNTPNTNHHGKTTQKKP